MIFVFVGEDEAKRREAVSVFLGKYEGETLVRIDDQASVGEIDSLASGDDLFANKYVVVLDRVFSDSDYLFGKIPAMADSDNIFVIIEDGFDKETISELQEYAKKIEKFEKKTKKEEKFNIFSITDAFGARDKKNTWVLSQKAFREGLASEEVLNILIWQTKNLLLAKGSKSAKETGLSPFVYTKAKKYSDNFKQEELAGISRELSSLFHESHLGIELGPNLELFLLRSL